MKVRVLASLSGPQGRKVAGEEFVVSAADGKELIDRKLVEAVEQAAVEPGKDTTAEKTTKKAAAKE